VIELLSPEVIVRRDIREPLTCVACEGEPMCAPAGETVVPNSKLGLGASILVENYLDGLPLHRMQGCIHVDMLPGVRGHRTGKRLVS
jgi:hypothetical protein